ncbi:hypothetical protein DFH08DRAFT_862143 [Mycena albidolilacea]|uniref:F-box domain-containing protein n=1 Tax=Mycena albidolilacea TaxID=1033008 RepID=A0AAD7A7J7_9AGAR|nr:hypothetical protein DFH08DRAFT_862143 [Mycena albidolilacea]
MPALQNIISTLPHELLGEIFTSSAAGFPHAPIVLGAVSRLFRHVAYTTPSAWSHLELSDANGGGKAALWFKLSKAHDVDVQIDIKARVGRPQHGVEDATAKAPTAVETLQFHTHRIPSLCIRTDTQAEARAALAAIYSDVHPTSIGLRSLRISSAATPVTSDALLAFPAIPSLIDLESTNIPLSALLSLDLRNVQSLRVVQPLLSPPIAIEDIVELGCAAPSLRRLHVEGRIAEPTTGVAVEQCFLPHLSELHLRANNIIALLDRFIVPALRQLHISDFDGKRANASAEMGVGLHRLLVRMELGKGDVKSNELRVLEVAGVKVEQSDAAWQRCMQRMKLEVFNVDSPGERSQEAIAKVETCPQEPRTRPIEAGFGFGFGF